MPRHRSSASPLAWGVVALIVYASLYPFSGWQIPGVPLFNFLRLPWPRWWTWFDLIANLLGYLPLGALVFGARVRGGTRVRVALTQAVLAGAVLSFAMETLQNFLPQRVASNVDLGLNALGTVLGALLGAWVHARGGVDRWQAARDRWFIDRSAGALALLLLWPVGLLFPLCPNCPVDVRRRIARLRGSLELRSHHHRPGPGTASQRAGAFRPRLAGRRGA